ncbi:glycosyltransferase family A protein [Soonwooa sp.]|uniref:glycosyltransferase family 2 protein n=1 Tax=Soonwooa sp. TaxID=1938592 RepID=UPI0028ADD38E|nr:glycosyltransferase family A protein [Soonwooa sp.]
MNKMIELKPTISIVVPCYNQAHYMDECLQSVLDQTFQNWECIIVDDGSPDNTEEIALNWVEKDKRIRYLKKINGGLSSARNEGIKMALGQWILPLDCDDKIATRYLEIASKEFKNGYTIIYCLADYFGKKNEAWILPQYSHQQMCQQNIIFCSAFFEKKSWEKVGGYDTNMIFGLEDWDFWLSILDENSTVKKIQYKGFFYRIKDSSMLTNLQSDRLNLMKKMIFKKHHIFIENYLGSYYDILKERNKYQKESNLYRKLFQNRLFRFLVKLKLIKIR